MKCRTCGTRMHRRRLTRSETRFIQAVMAVDAVIPGRLKRQTVWESVARLWEAEQISVPSLFRRESMLQSILHVLEISQDWFSPREQEEIRKEAKEYETGPIAIGGTEERR